MEEKVSVEEALSREVVRKLRLAAEAETKDDREIICEELFCDITGTLDVHAQERLGLSLRVDDSTPPAVSPSSSPSQIIKHNLNRLPSSSITEIAVGNPRKSKTDQFRDLAPAGPSFYQVLARFYQQSRDSGEAVSHLCQRLWGQGYAAPIFALLLHRWLLLGRDLTPVDGSKGNGSHEKAQRSTSAEPGGAESASGTSNADAGTAPASPALSGWRGLGYMQPSLLSPYSKQQPQAQQQQPQRVKQISVLVLGARQLFLGDVHTGQTRFVALYRCLCDEIIMGPGMSLLSRLPLSLRSDLLSAVAAVLPYYSHPAQMHSLIASLPPPSATAQQLQHQGRDAGVAWNCAPGSGADFLLGEVSDMLGRIRSEAGLLQYLVALQALKGSPHLRTLHNITSLRLQSELYSLTSPGGPHYAPRPVRVAAMKTLDALYPLGRRTRRVVRMLFRLLHPTDWLGEFWLVPFHWWAWLYTRVLLAAFWMIYSVIWRRPRSSTSRETAANVARKNR